MADHPEVITGLDRMLAPFPGSRSVQDVLAVLFLGTGLFAFWWAVIGLLAVRCRIRPLHVPAAVQRVRSEVRPPAGMACLLLFAVWFGFAYRIAAEAEVM